MAFYKRKLPHFQPAQAEFFVTFRLANSLPKPVVEEIKTERRILNPAIQKYESDNNLEVSDRLTDLHRQRKLLLKKFENFLDKAETGPTWLKKEKIAEIVKEALRHRDEKRYDLYAYCIMPNHVHAVFRLLNFESIDETEDDYPLTIVLQNMKSYTALECNRVLDREGTFWQSESYDRVIRDQDERENVIRYTLYNPVKAGLVDHWNEWPHTYIKPIFADDM
jgi:REP element-mobilizing transposase RayT